MSNWWRLVSFYVPVDKNICPLLTLSKHVRFPSHSDLTSLSGDRYSVFIVRLSQLILLAQKYVFDNFISLVSDSDFSTLEIHENCDSAYPCMGADRKDKLQVRSSNYRLGDWVIALPVLFSTTFSKRKRKHWQTYVSWLWSWRKWRLSLSGRWLLFKIFFNIYFLSLFLLRPLAHRKKPLSIAFLFLESLWMRVCLCLNYKRRSYASFHNSALASVSVGFFNIHLKEME